MSDEMAALILEQVAALRAQMDALCANAERKMPERPLTALEFGKLIGRSPKTVRRLVKAGKVKAKQEGRILLISPQSAKRFLEPQGGRGGGYVDLSDEAIGL